MNKLSLCTLFVILQLFIACSKADDTGITPTPGGERKAVNSLKGTWELRAIYGGMLPPGAGPSVQPGSGNRWKFTSNTYQMFSKGNLVSSGTYSRLRDSSLQAGRMMEAMQLTGGSQSLIHYEFVADTLVMYSGMIAADGTIQKYVPVNSLQ